MSDFHQPLDYLDNCVNPSELCYLDLEQKNKMRTKSSRKKSENWIIVVTEKNVGLVD
jgi:hypothetical protein